MEKFLKNDRLDIEFCIRGNITYLLQVRSLPKPKSGLKKVNYSKKEFDKYGKVSFHSNVAEACLKSDLIIIHTEWDEFKLLEFKKIVKKSNFKIFDIRNLYSSKLMEKNKIIYFGIGK